MTKLSTLIDNINNTQVVEQNVYKLAKCVDASYKQSYDYRVINCEVKKGKKYWKLIFDNSVHAFVDVNNGDVFKPASWNKPAKHVRYNLLTNPEICFSKCDWAGGYLYIR